MNLLYRILAWHYSRQASKLRLWAIRDYRSANKLVRRLEWLAVRSRKLCSGRYLSGKGKGAGVAYVGSVCGNGEQFTNMHEADKTYHENKHIAYRMRNEGYTMTEIANHFSTASSTIRNWFRTMGRIN